MKTISKGEALDLILQYCLDKTEKEYVSLNELQTEVLTDVNEDIILLLLERIENSTDKIAEVIISEYTTVIRATGLTERFLEQGGFTASKKKEQAELEQEKKHKYLEFKLAESNIRANKLNVRIAKRNKRETIINIILGLINIGILIWQSLLIVKSSE